MTAYPPQLRFRQMEQDDLPSVMALGNKVHGDNYLTEENLPDYFARGHSLDGRNLHWLCFADDILIGIRITFAPGQWEIDSWCTPTAWPFPKEQLCYFKCSAVDPDFQGSGVGKSLLSHSIVEAQGAGCRGGLAHIWRQSPNNSAFAYFTRCGGELIRDHQDRWHRSSVEEGYYCPVCEGICHCTAAEMLLRF